jgi:anti-anti-sigma regulatory factor
MRTARSLLDRARVLAAQSSTVTVDCAELVQCDTAGLQVLLALRNALGARGGMLRVINVPTELAWRFDYAGLVHSAS